jgi:hypothetical protein
MSERVLICERDPKRAYDRSDPLVLYIAQRTGARMRLPVNQDTLARWIATVGEVQIRDRLESSGTRYFYPNTREGDPRYLKARWEHVITLPVENLFFL